MAPNLNFVNIPDLNKVLRSEVFMSEDRQLRAIHLILKFKPLSGKFQDVGNAIKAGDPWLARLLAQEDIVQVELPSHRSPREVAAPREETASSRLSFETEIDQFQLEEERKEQGEPVIQVSDLKDELYRFSGVHTSSLIVARIDNSSKEEEEEMSLNKKRGLRELVADKAKGSAPKDASGSQPPLPFSPPSPPPLVNPFAPANLKKKKKKKGVAKEGELVPQNEGVPPSRK